MKIDPIIAGLLSAGDKKIGETHFMSTIAVELPGELQTFVDIQVQGGHFSNANDYIIALIDAARQNRTSLEAELLAGLRSGPAEEWTNQEWVEIRHRVIERHSQV